MRIDRNTLLFIALWSAAAAAPAQSLYNEATFQSLTADRRALRPGDSLTVLVMENSSASASANTTTQKVGGITAGINCRAWSVCPARAVAANRLASGHPL